MIHTSKRGIIIKSGIGLVTTIFLTFVISYWTYLKFFFFFFSLLTYVKAFTMYGKIDLTLNITYDTFGTLSYWNYSYSNSLML